MTSQTRQLPQLHLVTDDSLGTNDLMHAVLDAVSGGVDVVRLRSFKQTDDDMLNLARAIRQEARTETRIWVHHRVNVARRGELDGVQLSVAELASYATDAAQTRTWQLGVSVHALNDVRLAQETRANTLTFGHVFDSTTHPNEVPKGLGLLRQVVTASALPVIAIGGITATNAHQVLQAGAVGVAVISAILGSADPRHAAKTLRTVLDREVLND